MKINISKRKVEKGTPGYFKAEKKRQLIFTLLLFSMPLLIFFSSWIYYGTRKTFWTILVVVGCLPACIFLLNFIMVVMRKPIDETIYQKIKAHAGKLLMSYEMFMTFYEKSAYIDAFAICGNEVVGYSSDPKIDAGYMALEAQKIICKNGYKVHVKILTDLKPYLERLDSMNAHRESLEKDIKFVPDERYPNLSRTEIIKQVILAICL